MQCYGIKASQGMVHIVLEYMDMGSVAALCKSRMPEHIVGAMACQVAYGLHYLHKEKKIIHRDIKPSNLLVSSQGNVKIADFGVSGQLLNTHDNKQTWVGTAKYMSPERYLGSTYNASTDLWSLGMVILECITGQYPF